MTTEVSVRLVRVYPDKSLREEVAAKIRAVIGGHACGVRFVETEGGDHSIIVGTGLSVLENGKDLQGLANALAGALVKFHFLRKAQVELREAFQDKPFTARVSPS